VKFSELVQKLETTSEDPVVIFEHRIKSDETAKENFSVDEVEIRHGFLVLISVD
jgi:hypothetical protein